MPGIPIRNMSQIDTTRLQAVIVLLSVVIKIGKYLPFIVLAFAALNLSIAISEFAIGGVSWGVINLVLAGAGFYFFYQLFQRRKVHRYDYRYSGRHSTRPKIKKRTIKYPANVEAQ